MIYATKRHAVKAVPDTVIQAAERAASNPPFTGATYAFSFASVASALASIDPLALVGVTLAVVTFIANQVWAWVRHRRESKQAALQMEIDQLQIEEMQKRIRQAGGHQ